MMAVAENRGLRGELRQQELLAGYTTWRVGGPARRLYRPADAEDLAQFLAGLPADEPLLWLGLGSNLLVRDGGFPGTVILTHGRLNEIVCDEAGRLSAGAGAACAHVARQAARHGLCGAAFLAGIPGTIGGALAMNAGAFGGEIWRLVNWVETVDRSGRMHRRSPAEYRVAYREVGGPEDEWFTACELQLDGGDVASEQEEIRRLLERRKLTQPTDQATAGSTFRNPPGDYAARLIEASGLKGFAIGGAEVSAKHANFVVNTGTATAADIEALIAHVQMTVLQLQGVELRLEVHIVGVAQ